MKLAIKKQQIVQLAEEVLAEFTLAEANPFEEEGDDAAEDKPAKEEEGEGEKEAKTTEKGADNLTIKFEPASVKKYNTNTDWRSGEGVVKGITKKGVEVEVDGSMVVVNFDDLVDKAATMLYYTIIAGLAVYSGIGAISAFKNAASVAAHAGSFEIGVLEAAMAAIKSGEVVDFMGSMGLSAAEAT